jgi:hypothetical protein
MFIFFLKRPWWDRLSKSTFLFSLLDIMSTTKRCMDRISEEWDAMVKKPKRTRVTLIYAPPVPDKILVGDLELTPEPPEVIVISLDEGEDTSLPPKVSLLGDSSDESSDDDDDLDTPAPSPVVSEPPEVIDISDDDDKEESHTEEEEKEEDTEDSKPFIEPNIMNQ